MNREIKLRYFWKGEWHYIDLYKDNTIAKFEAYESVKCSLFYQFTGLKDKNGKEIYFNSDYVQYVYENSEDEEQEEFGIIVLDLKFTLGICVKTNDGMLLPIVHSDLNNIEIIGNIYENLELIK